MNRKIIGILGLTGLMLTGCASPEVETEQTMIGAYSLNEIMQDNGQKIEKHFQNEGEDGVLDINAIVDIPNTSLKEGVIQSKEWDISMLKNVLCPETDMILEKNSQSDYMRYIGGATYNDLNYDTYIEISKSDNSLVYCNYKLDAYFVNAGFELRNQSDWTESEQKFVREMEENSIDLYSKLGIEAEVENTDLTVTNGKKYCSIKMLRTLDGCPWLDAGGEPIGDTIQIAEPGINGLSLSEQYTIEDAKEASVLSIDEIMQIIDMGVKNGNIHTYIVEDKGFDYTIQSIRMGYMTEIEDGAMHFFPVWYFQCKLGEKGITLLALDARNGAVAYMG